MSQLIEADRLLRQWASWCAGEMRALDYVSASWQAHYDSGYQEESPKASTPPGSDADMLRVDEALGRVKRANFSHFHVLSYVYRRDAEADLSRQKLDAALRAFIDQYWYGEEIGSMRALG